MLPERRKKGRQVDNVRLPLSNESLVKDFIRVSEKLFQLMNEGE